MCRDVTSNRAHCKQVHSTSGRDVSPPSMCQLTWHSRHRQKAELLQFTDLVTQRGAKAQRMVRPQAGQQQQSWRPEADVQGQDGDIEGWRLEMRSRCWLDHRLWVRGYAELGWSRDRQGVKRPEIRHPCWEHSFETNQTMKWTVDWLVEQLTNQLTEQPTNLTLYKINNCQLDTCMNKQVYRCSIQDWS